MPAHPASAEPDTGVALTSARGRWVLLACVLGSGLAGIDATVVNIALPQIGRDLGVGFAALQWTVSGYTLTLAALILLGGALGDRFGRRRVFVIGAWWFAAASLLCALAPGVVWLVAARVLQGVGAALLTPASLAILQSTIVRADRTRAIGAWSGLSGTAAAIAPFLGGWLLAAGSWRWVFLINPPLAVLVGRVAARHVPETRDAGQRGRVDIVGAALCVLALGAITAGAIRATDAALTSFGVLAPVAVGLVSLLAFVVVEQRERNPMLPPGLFRSRTFTATNSVTFLLYAANSASLLLLVVALETVSGFSPLEAGTALLPITVIMLALAARFGALAQRIGPRIPMSLGPLVSAGGLVLFAQLSPHSSYWGQVLPAVAVFGLGLSVFVAPLTATVLGSAPAEHAGVASGVNNAIARAAGLLAVAALPVLVGLRGQAYESAQLYLPPFRTAMWICAGLHVAGAFLAAVSVPSTAPRRLPPGTSWMHEHLVPPAGQPEPRGLSALRRLHQLTSRSTSHDNGND